MLLWFETLKLFDKGIFLRYLLFFRHRQFLRFLAFLLGYHFVYLVILFWLFLLDYSSGICNEHALGNHDIFIFILNNIHIGSYWIIVSRIYVWLWNIKGEEIILWFVWFFLHDHWRKFYTFKQVNVGRKLLLFGLLCNRFRGLSEFADKFKFIHLSGKLLGIYCGAKTEPFSWLFAYVNLDLPFLFMNNRKGQFKVFLDYFLIQSNVPEAQLRNK